MMFSKKRGRPFVRKRQRERKQVPNVHDLTVLLHTAVILMRMYLSRRYTVSR